MGRAPASGSRSRPNTVHPTTARSNKQTLAQYKKDLLSASNPPFLAETQPVAKHERSACHELGGMLSTPQALHRTRTWNSRGGS